MAQKSTPFYISITFHFLLDFICLLAFNFIIIICLFSVYPTHSGIQPLWLVMQKTLEVVAEKKENYITSLNDIYKEINDYASKQDDQLKGKVLREGGREGGRE